MKKIGVITYHNAISYGASFQTFGLQKYLENNGYDVRIINYLPPRFRWQNIFHVPNAAGLMRKIIKFLPYVIHMGTAYSLTIRFAKKYLTVTDELFYTEQDLKAANLDMDAYITGSDQVWNLNFDEMPYIRPFLLSFAPEGRPRISYAASIGMTSLSAVDTNDKVEYLQLLKKYDYLSVREKSAADLLNQEGISAQWVLDPTFLLDAAQWRQLAQKPRKSPSGSFLFVYGLYRNRNLYAVAHKLAKKNGLQIVNMADSYDFCSGAYNDIYVTHEQLLWYLSHAACVLTDSFHGTVLSLNFNTPVYIFPAPRYNTRLESVIQLFSLSDRLVTDENLAATDIFDMDYAQINERMETERRKSKEYLEAALK